jgi:hypothetical protein
MTLRLFASALAARDYFPLLRWMIFTGVTVFGFAIAWHYGVQISGSCCGKLDSRASVSSEA